MIKPINVIAVSFQRTPPRTTALSHYLLLHLLSGSNECEGHFALEKAINWNYLPHYSFIRRRVIPIILIRKYNLCDVKVQNIIIWTQKKLKATIYVDAFQ